MAGLVLEAFQQDPGANDADDAWLASSLETLRNNALANDADDAWLSHSHVSFVQPSNRPVLSHVASWHSVHVSGHWDSDM